jgi:hypothetical protein
MLGMSCRSSGCDGIYRWRISIGMRGGGFCSFSICRYGEISWLVGILLMLLGYVYLLWIRISSPPLGGVYGIQNYWLYLVGVCVLLKNSLYWGNILCMYFGDFLEVNFVSWRVNMAGVYCSM